MPERSSPAVFYRARVRSPLMPTLLPSCVCVTPGRVYEAGYSRGLKVGAGRALGPFFTGHASVRTRQSCTGRADQTQKPLLQKSL